MSAEFLSLSTPIGNIWRIAQEDEAVCSTLVREIHMQDDYRVKSLKAEGFEPKTIVDIGANIGVFTVLARHLWPNARITAYEPQLSFFKALAMNSNGDTHPVCFPVFGEQDAPELFPDQELWKQSGVCVAARIACYEADLLKIDCEGAEAGILLDLKQLGLLDSIAVITGEWHRASRREAVVCALRDTHDLEIDGADLGLFFARRKC